MTRSYRLLLIFPRLMSTKHSRNGCIKNDQIKILEENVVFNSAIYDLFGFRYAQEASTYPPHTCDANMCI